MFVIGEKIVYGSTGVCTITDIGIPDLPGASHKCYVLKPHFIPNSKVYAPIEGNPVNIRSVFSVEEMKELIENISEIEAYPAEGDKDQQHRFYRDILKTGGCHDLARLLKTLYHKKEFALGQRKILPMAEKEIFDTTKKVLFGEIATSLDIEIDEVERYIDKKLEEKAKNIS